MTALVKGFGGRPFTGRSGEVRGRRSKASQGGNRGEEGRWLIGRDLWGFEDRGRLACVAAEAGGAQCCRRERGRRGCSVVRICGFGVGAALGANLRTWRGQRPCAPAHNWRRKRSALRDGMRSDDHEVSILIGRGGACRAGRTPSKVSMMIIRPPQHGHRRADEGVSVWLSASV